MPSKSPAQARLMAMVAHNPKMAKKTGVPLKVAKEFNKADTGTGILKTKMTAKEHAEIRKGADKILKAAKLVK